MSRVKLAALAIGLLGLQLSACSYAEPTPKDFVLVNPHAAEDAPPPDTSPPRNWSKIGKTTARQPKAGKDKGTKTDGGHQLEAMEAACKAETEHKGTASMLAIFTRLRKGSADQDYIDCMKEHGYEVKP
jgi:hypothetical protein